MGQKRSKQKTSDMERKNRIATHPYKSGSLWPETQPYMVAYHHLEHKKAFFCF